MAKLRRPYVALALSIAAVAAAGCGTSSSTKSQATSRPAASTPATPSTPSATTTSAAITPSTPITDPAYRANVLKGISLAAKGRISPADQGKLADCAIKKFEAEGVRTAGEAEGKTSQARTFGAECAAELHLTIK